MYLFNFRVICLTQTAKLVGHASMDSTFLSHAPTQVGHVSKRANAVDDVEKHSVYIQYMYILK